jgi:hypothetical protein
MTPELELAKVTVSAGQPAHQPDVVVDLFDAGSLTGEERAEIDPS